MFVWHRHNTKSVLIVIVGKTIVKVTCHGQIIVSNMLKIFKMFSLDESTRVHGNDPISVGLLEYIGFEVAQATLGQKQ